VASSDLPSERPLSRSPPDVAHVLRHRSVIHDRLVRCTPSPSFPWSKPHTNPCTVARGRTNSGDAPVSRRRCSVSPHHQRPKPPSTPEPFIREWTSQIAYPFRCVIGPRWTRRPAVHNRPTASSTPSQHHIILLGQSQRAAWHHLSQAAPSITFLLLDPCRTK
jgi:hypothetical protein